jgi:hypothetical protein
MKPIFISDRDRSNPDRFVRQVPLTDCNYQASSYADLWGGRCGRAPAPSFRNISRDYFHHEAGRTFVAEAVFFSAIIITAAIALGIGAIAAIDFLRTLDYF